MAGFGGFCPLPLRLGGTAEQGWSPEQHARLCADLTAAVGMAPRMVVRYTTTGGTLTVNSVRTMQGAGLAHVPTMARTGVGAVLVSLASLKDAYGQAATMAAYHMTASPLWDGATPAFTNVLVGTSEAVEFTVQRYTLAGVSFASQDGPACLTFW